MENEKRRRRRGERQTKRKYYEIFCFILYNFLDLIYSRISGSLIRRVCKA